MNLESQGVLLPLIVAFFASAALAAVCGAVALTFARFAVCGGAAIALTLFLTSAIFALLPAVQVLLACTAALLVVGLTTDLVAFKPSTRAVARVVAQIAVASVFLFFDYRLHWTDTLSFAWIDSITVDRVLTVFWVVAVISAFNLLDNMDGLCAGIGFIAGIACLMAVLPLAPQGMVLMRTEYLAALVGAAAGFLIFNIHPARVRLGDGGSLVIGVNMAAVPLLVAPGSGSDLLSIVAVPALVLLIPIVDATVFAVSRLLPGRRDVPAARDYSSHRLVAMGLTERAAVGLLWLLAAAGGVIGVLAGRTGDGLGMLAAATFIIAIALFAAYLARVEVQEDAEPGRRSSTLGPVITTVSELLLDLLLVSIAYYGAYLLRFDGLQYTPNLVRFQQSFPVIVGTQMVALFAVGAYRGMWRYFGLNDGVRLAQGVFLGVVTSQVVLLYLYRFSGYSMRVFVVYGMLLLLLLVSSRASFRLFAEFGQSQRTGGRRLVIYGASDAGAVAVRHLLQDPRSGFRVVGFVDDDLAKRNIRVHGYRVIGGYDHMIGMIMGGQVEAVAITQERPDTPGLAWLCRKYNVTLYRLTIDWREVPAADAVASEAPVALAAAEPRVVPFSDPMPRDRLRAAPAADRRRASRWSRGHVAVVGDAPQWTDSLAITEPVRVVHVITRLILGGAQENTLYTAIGQHRDPRFDVTVLCGVDEAGEGNMFGEANRADLRVVVMPSLIREIRPLTDLKALFDLYRFLKRGRYTIVHTHSSKAGILGRMASRLAGVPIVVHTMHGVVFHEFQSSWKNALYIVLKRFCAPMTDRIISVSDRVAEAALAKRIGRRDQHVTIFSGIDLDRFLSARERLTVDEAKLAAGIPPDAPVVGKIARLFPLKGHEQFLAAAQHIAREMPDVWFLLVGDGPLREEVRATARRLGFGQRLVMVGRVPPETVPDYIQAMDVVVHTSLREGIARVLPQAGAVGKPVVTFDLDGAPEVIRNGVSGYLVRPLDTAAVARCTMELLRSPERREAFGAAGRAFAAEHFSVERMVERINAVYFDLLSKRPFPSAS